MPEGVDVVFARGEMFRFVRRYKWSIYRFGLGTTIFQEYMDQDTSM